VEPEWGEWGQAMRVRIDHAPVRLFAHAVKDTNPVYASERAARDAGFDAVPAPPTFTFVMSHSGAYPDLQRPEFTGRMMPQSDLPADGYSRHGLYLHGEQHFEYHRQPQVGDVLEGRMRISKPMPKQGSRGTMELTLIETRWTDLDGEPVVTEQIVSLFLPGA
jgi:MaoC dehydratase-like protein